LAPDKFFAKVKIHFVELEMWGIGKKSTFVMARLKKKGGFK